MLALASDEITTEGTPLILRRAGGRWKAQPAWGAVALVVALAAIALIIALTGCGSGSGTLSPQASASASREAAAAQKIAHDCYAAHKNDPRKMRAVAHCIFPHGISLRADRCILSAYGHNKPGASKASREAFLTAVGGCVEKYRK